MARTIFVLAALLLLAFNASAAKVTAVQWINGLGCDSSNSFNALTVDLGACVTTQQATVKFSDNGATVNYGYGCDSTCASCLITGTVAYDTCIEIASPLGNFNASIMKTRFPAYTQSDYYTTRPGTDFATCADPQSGSATTFESGVCYQETKTGKYQRFFAVESATWTYGFSRNCTDSTCATCTIAAVYTSAQKCARVNDLPGGTSDFGFINTITDGTAPATTQPSGSSTAASLVLSAVALVAVACVMMF